MKKIIILDSSPLGLLFQEQGIPEADRCRAWLTERLAAGVQILVPEIVTYELRRELLRLKKSLALTALSAFTNQVPGRVLPLASPALQLAAELWAQTRQAGLPTADRHALDIDVILSAQVRISGLPLGDLVIATSNVKHLAHFVPAELWSKIG